MCTEHRLKLIEKRRVELDRLKAQGSAGVESVVELMVLEQELAREHCHVGGLMGRSLRPTVYSQAVLHCQQALHLHRKVETSRGTLRGAAVRAAAGKLADKVASCGLYDTLRQLGDIYRFQAKDVDALQVFQEVLGEVRSDNAQESTPQLQAKLAEILYVTGSVYLDQYNHQINSRAKADKGKCSAAKALLEEGLVICREVKSDNGAADSLRLLASAYSHLGMHDEARGTLKEALDLTCSCVGQMTAEVAACHEQMAFICQKQADEIRQQVNIHKEYIVTNLMSCYHSPGRRVRVAGLQNKPEFNGLEGVVVKVGALRIVVRLHNDKELKLKPENVQPLIPTAAKLQELILKIQEIAQERIASSKEAYRIQIKVTGVKHVNTAVSCYALATAYMKTWKPADTGEAVALLIKADKIRLHVGDERHDTKNIYSNALSEAKVALARFDEVGRLSAVPCCWFPTSPQEDKEHMSQLFAGLQVRDGKRGSPSMSSEVMYQGLRLYGLFDVTASVSDPVSGTS